VNEAGLNGLRQLSGKRLAIEPAQRGFGIEGIHMTDAAVHEKRNDALGVSGERRLLRRERTLRGSENPRKSRQSEATTGFCE